MICHLGHQLRLWATAMARFAPSVNPGSRQQKTRNDRLDPMVHTRRDSNPPYTTANSSTTRSDGLYLVCLKHEAGGSRLQGPREAVHTANNALQVLCFQAYLMVQQGVRSTFTSLLEAPQGLGGHARTVSDPQHATWQMGNGESICNPGWGYNWAGCKSTNAVSSE